MKKLLWGIAPLLIIMAIAADLYAEDPMRGRALRAREEALTHGGAQVPSLLARLNLTDEQKAKIKILRDTHRASIKPLQDQMFKKRDDLKQLWLQPHPDKEKISAAQKEVASLREQIQRKNEGHRLDLFNVLTREQQEKSESVFSGYGKGRPAGGTSGKMGGPGTGWELTN